MSDQITPEEAQAQTILDWTAMTKGIYDHSCGWCKFSSDVSTGCEDSCPVARLAKMKCTDIPEYKAWRNAKTPEDNGNAAQAVLDLLEENDKRLIEIGHKILAEGKQ